MKNKFLISVLSICAALSLAIGWQGYRQHPLKPLAAELLPSVTSEETHVVVTVKALSPDESKKYVGHDLISRGVQPLQLTIQNNTPNQYSLCPSSVDLPRIEASKVAFKVSKSAIPRAIGYKVAGFIFWPFIIPGTVDSIRTYAKHRQLKKDLLAKSMKEEIIAPYSTYHRLLFVPQEEFQDNFAVTLIDLETLQPVVLQTSVTVK